MSQRECNEQLPKMQYKYILINYFLWFRFDIKVNSTGTLREHLPTMKDNQRQPAKN